MRRVVKSFLLPQSSSVKVTSTTPMHNTMKCIRKITIFWKAKALFCVQKTAGASIFYLNLSAQTCFQADIFCLFCSWLREPGWLILCKGNIDFQSRSASSTPCFHEYKNIYASPRSITSPGKYFILISEISNLELKSDRKKFYFSYSLCLYPPSVKEFSGIIFSMWRNQQLSNHTIYMES